MTEEQKKQIETLRLNGCGYTRIAQMIGISENTVKSFCRRNKLTGSVLPKMQYPVDSKKHFCLCCGAVVEQNPGIKYLRTLGFQATNDIFAENAWYFRNALVRANYNNLVKGIHETTEFLELFLCIYGW